MRKNLFKQGDDDLIGMLGQIDRDSDARRAAFEQGSSLLAQGRDSQLLSGERLRRQTDGPDRHNLSAGNTAKPAACLDSVRPRLPRETACERRFRGGRRIVPRPDPDYVRSHPASDDVRSLPRRFHPCGYG